MEKHFIWVFFIVALFLGFMIGIVYTNSLITGFVTEEALTEISAPAESTESESMEPHTSETTSSVTITDVQPTFWQRLFGITKTQPLVSNCTDSDGDWNMYVKGTCYGSNGQFTDFCIDDSTLREFACDGNNCLSMNYLCNGTCSNGACSGGEVQTILEGQTTETCSDSDYGVNYYKHGVCTDATGSYADACEGHFVKEYYCTIDGECNWIPQKCGALYGSITCSQGVCKTEEWLEPQPQYYGEQIAFPIANGGGGGKWCKCTYGSGFCLSSCNSCGSLCETYFGSSSNTCGDNPYFC